MEKTRTPPTKWFAAIYLVAEDKHGLSAMALQRKIGAAYFTAWTMVQKIRFAMGNRDEKHMLDGILEMDEGFFGGKRGRGTEKTAVLVSVSLNDWRKPKFSRIKTLESVNGEAVKTFAKEHVKPGSEIRTDGLNLYNCLANENIVKVYSLFFAESLANWMVENAKIYFIETDNEFIASDQPIINSHSNSEITLEPVKEMEFYYPITPHLALFLPRRTLKTKKLINLKLMNIIKCYIKSPMNKYMHIRKNVR